MADGPPFHDLIRRVRDRDPAAARELVLRYESAIRRVVRIHLRDNQMRRLLDSTDVCQSVLASFFIRTALGQYEIGSPAELLNLLTAIARNKLANQANRLRARRRDIRRQAPAPDEAEGAVDRASAPDAQVEAREILDKVRERLGPDERYLADQRAIGRSWPELAAELGKTDVALRKQLSRALDRVMAGMGIEGEGDG